ncbi:uncharacterized protein LOC123200962 [Mangifera indica]|uniref:uncharacterized protein LOC123200962 n=1 Tax=Mangifera indica TaxID=29780 RepID=UPI001CFB3FA1|nr:uncharacterized protein LOC123200962 [Mangifera indica]
MVMELQLKLALRAYNPTIGFHHGGQSNIAKNKRSFEDAFSHQSAGMMPLHVWSGQPNEEDDQKGQNKRASSPSTRMKRRKNWLLGGLLYSHGGRNCFTSISSSGVKLVGSRITIR